MLEVNSSPEQVKISLCKQDVTDGRFFVFAFRRADIQSNGDVLSPAGRRLMCPICMDGYTQVLYGVW